MNLLECHDPTYRAAIAGWPTRKHAMKLEDAMRIAKKAMRDMLLRESKAR